MSDTGQDIEVPDEMTVADMISLKKDTQGRFDFNVHFSGKYANVTWVNYYKTATGKRSKDANGAYKLLARARKEVVII